MIAFLLLGLPLVAMALIVLWPSREQRAARRRRRAYRRARTVTLPRQRTTDLPKDDA
ncbi:hypothetical protein ACFVVU_23520 [Kitasatospora sp. NPDC057965]|uniref:hypothetical protein n=1 Tax=Kitasatospora sp. NPDC057965 TaxID=3346291 RepID=UPI0036D9E1E9